MTGRPDKRYLMVVLVFGLASMWGGAHWLSEGEIAIREAQRGRRVTAPAPAGKVSGRIKGDHALYYPVCTAWIVLGLSMVTLAVTAFFTTKTLYLKLSAYTLVVVLLFGAGTVALAMWLGP